MTEGDLALFSFMGPRKSLLRSTEIEAVNQHNPERESTVGISRKDGAGEQVLQEGGNDGHLRCSRKASMWDSKPVWV